MKKVRKNGRSKSLSEMQVIVSPSPLQPKKRKKGNPFNLKYRKKRKKRFD
jgi:hypothetical protein